MSNTTKKRDDFLHIPVLQLELYFLESAFELLDVIRLHLECSLDAIHNGPQTPLRHLIAFLRESERARENGAADPLVKLAYQQQQCKW